MWLNILNEVIQVVLRKIYNNPCSGKAQEDITVNINEVVAAGKQCGLMPSMWFIILGQIFKRM